MFRRDICSRCLLGTVFVRLHRSHLHQYSRNASRVSLRPQPNRAIRGLLSSYHGTSLPIAQLPRRQEPDPSWIARVHTGAIERKPPPHPAQTDDLLSLSTLAEDSNDREGQDSPDEPEDVRAIFTVTEEVRERLRDASQHIERYYERKRARNSILKSLQSSDWQTDWRTSFDLLRIEYVLGKYVENAQYASPKYRDPWTRWMRETSPFNIPEPQIFSKPAFHQYVQRILSLQSPRPLQRLLYPLDGQEESPIARDHVSQISKKIESIFRNEAFSNFFTTEAFEDALRFMIRRNRHSTARQLLNIMIENKIKIRTSTFNIFFGSAAFHSDLRFFTYILKLKQSLGIPGDAHTWASYLRTLLSTRAKSTVFWEMDKLGLFKDQVALQRCVVEIIDIELQKSLKQGKPFQLVLEQLDARFGLQWVSVAAANKICTFLGASGRIEEIPNVLTLMQSRGCGLTSETLSTLLYQASLMSDNQQALQVVKLFQSKYELLPRAQDFGPLFRAAWSTRSFNTCHIIWRLACGFGFVTRDMQQLVYRSLQRNTPPHPSTVEQRWMKEAGKVITFSRPHHPQLKALVGYEDAKDAYLTGDMRTEQRKLAASILRRDLLARMRGSFHGNWVQLYEAAVRRDEEWARKEILISKPLRWKLQRVIRLGTQTWSKRKKTTGTAYRHVSIDTFLVK